MIPTPVPRLLTPVSTQLEPAPLIPELLGCVPAPSAGSSVPTPPSPPREPHRCPQPLSSSRGIFLTCAKEKKPPKLFTKTIILFVS